MSLFFIVVAIVFGGILLLAILAGDSDREPVPRQDPHPKQMGER
jgi:Flp pilus assembly protein protease CpaA